MKFLCPHCERLSALEDFRLEAQTLWVRCAACQVESRAERQAEAVAQTQGQGAFSSPGSGTGAPLLSIVRPAAGGLEGSLEVPSGCCAKCISPRLPDQLICPRCGLVYDNFRPENFRLSLALETLWETARTQYANEPLHRRLIEAAHDSGELPLVARLYRIRLAWDPSDAVAKEAQLEVLRRASSPASLRLEAGPSRREAPTALQVALFLGVMAGAVAALLWMILRMIHPEPA